MMFASAARMRAVVAEIPASIPSMRAPRTPPRPSICAVPICAVPSPSRSWSRVIRTTIVTTGRSPPGRSQLIAWRNRSSAASARRCGIVRSSTSAIPVSAKDDGTRSRAARNCSPTRASMPARTSPAVSGGMSQMRRTIPSDCGISVRDRRCRRITSRGSAPASSSRSRNRAGSSDPSNATRGRTATPTSHNRTASATLICHSSARNDAALACPARRGSASGPDCAANSPANRTRIASRPRCSVPASVTRRNSSSAGSPATPSAHARDSSANNSRRGGLEVSMWRVSHPPPTFHAARIAHLISCL